MLISGELAGTQLLPPPRPSQAAPGPSQRSARHSTRNMLRGLTSQPPPASYLNNETLSTTDDSTSNSFPMSDPALPPNLPWDHFTLRTLRSLRATLTKRPTTSIAASVLGLVVDVSEVRDVGGGKRRAGFSVEDGSGARCVVVLWEEWVQSWAGVVRRGDVVFLGGESTPFDSAQRPFSTRHKTFAGLHLLTAVIYVIADVKLSLYQTALQAQPTHHPLSRAQICWRLQKLDEADEGYGFDPKWAETNPEAEAVWKVVEWVGGAYRGVFEGGRGGYRG